MPDIGNECDVAVVGAGPSGMAAASLCSRAGLATVVIDERAAPGGHAYGRVARLAREFAECGARFLGGCRVVSLTPDHQLHVTMQAQGERRLQATHVILATGARERPMPFPGAALPGVTMAGFALGELDATRSLPAGRTVLAGSGPLLWLLAGRVLRARGTIEALLDITPPENRSVALAHLPSFLLSPYLAQAARSAIAVRRRVPVVKNVVALEALGDDRVREVRYRTARGESRTLPVDSLVLHQGLVPQVALARAVGIEHRWDGAELCWIPLLQGFGASSLPGYYVVGDGAGVAGAEAAAWRGVLAAADIVHTRSPAAAQKAARLAGSALRGYARGRRYLDALHRPAQPFRPPGEGPA